MCNTYADNENAIWSVMDNAMKSVLEFYQGDWIGFLGVDLERGVWTPSHWCNPSSADKTMCLFQRSVTFQLLDRWNKAISADKVISITNTETIRDEFPDEYAVYQRLCCQGILAIPMKSHPTGFFVIRNPKRNITEMGKLQFLVSVFEEMVNEKKQVQGLKLALSQKNEVYHV